MRFTLLSALLLLVPLASAADPFLYTHDSSRQLATVDVATGEVALIGDMGDVMTDIAFAPDGRLYAMSFFTLYEVDPATGQATPIGAHGIPDGNALVFANQNVLYAMGADSTQLYQLNLATGTGTPLGDVGGGSAGDLAYNRGELYVSTVSATLIRIDLNPVSGTLVGNIGFPDVFGLATADDGVLYGISGTQILTVDTTTGEGELVVDFGGQGLQASFGSSFVGEALPTCPEVPFEGCLVASKAKLKVTEKKRGSEKVSVQLKGFPIETTAASFGDPIGGATFYDICLWREDTPVVRLTVDRAGATCGSKPCWKAKGDKGWSYKDGVTSASGVKKMSLLSGPSGKGGLKGSAANKLKKGQDYLPHGIAARYTNATSAFVQFAASDGQCYEAVLGVDKADGKQVKAKK